MRVLHIIDSLGLGGAQTVVKGIFEAQPNNDNIFLFALRKREINIKINHPNVAIFDSKLKYSFKPLNELRLLIKKEKIDVLHCHLFRSQVFGYILKRRYFPNIKLIFHEHGEIFQNHKLYNLFMKQSIGLVNLIVAVSESTKKELVMKASIPKHKIRVLYNFVDLDKFNKKNITWNIQKERQKLGIKKSEFVVGFVGRLSKEKGCEYLINAAAYLNFNSKFILAGEGYEKDRLIRLSRELSVEDKIIFLGYRQDVKFIYSLIDVLVVPSISESFGISIIEAQAMGVPIIASNLPALKELVINKQTGLLFDTTNVLDLSNKIKNMNDLKSMRKKFSINGMKMVKNYSSDNYLHKLKELYEDVYD
jgi:glycosyltransferase involved in cell wall biosynthesis